MSFRCSQLSSRPKSSPLRLASHVGFPTLAFFDDLVLQNDPTGMTVGGIPGAVYAITSDGQPGGTANVVITATGGLAGATGIATENDNAYWTFASASGTPVGADNLILTGNRPGLTDDQPVGTFADFFAEPQDLRNATLRALVRVEECPLLGLTPRGPACEPVVTAHYQLQDETGGSCETAGQSLAATFLECHRRKRFGRWRCSRRRPLAHS